MPQLSNEQKEQIAYKTTEAAEAIWWKFPAELPNEYRIPCIAGMEDVIGELLTAEAERAAKLVEALHAIIGENPNPRLPLGKIIKEIAERALTEYHNQTITKP